MKKLSLPLIVEGFFLGVIIEGFIVIIYSNIGNSIRLSPVLLLIFSSFMIFLGVAVLYIFLDSILRSADTEHFNYLTQFLFYDLSIILGGYIIRMLLSL